MTTLRIWATHPLVPAVAVAAVCLLGLAIVVALAGPGMLPVALGLLALGVSTIPLRPAAAPRARRTLPRHAKRRGYGASAPFARRDGRAHKPAPGAVLRGGAPGALMRPAASTEDMPCPGREAPPAQLDRTQRLPVTFRVGRAPVGGAR